MIKKIKTLAQTARALRRRSKAFSPLMNIFIVI
jgi:hypothetical protein